MVLVCVLGILRTGTENNRWDVPDKSTMLPYSIFDRD